MNKYIYAASALLISGLILSVIWMSGEIKNQKQDNELLRAQNESLSKSLAKLSVSFEEVTKQKTYAITLAPNVNSKISAVFGNAKQLTLQYYFTMDGNKMEMHPDSVLEVRRVE